MSVYTVNKLCRCTLHDPELRAAIKRDPAAAIASWPLSSQEREALLAGDVARLYEMGVHPFLLSHLSRWALFGLTVPVYSERIRKAREPSNFPEADKSAKALASRLLDDSLPLE